MSTTGQRPRHRGPKFRYRSGPPMPEEARLEQRLSAGENPAPEVRQPRARGPPKPRPGEDALSLPEFCRRNAISLPFYYKLKAQGLGPRELRLGARVLITAESAEAWRREREAETAATAA